ncbi:hypothetical protein HUW86_09880 [Fusobacterium sp. SB021]|uniref:hypothetical protein n=1 Tax=Fusobacterium sp. SB021 TaxID=2744227 RepID=UPI003CECCBF7
MYLQYRDLKLIETSGRPDEDNEKILKGEFLNKSLKDFEMPSRDEMMEYIFSDWQIGDILVIADKALRYPKKSGDTLVEMTLYEAYQNGLYELKYNEVIYEDDILVLEQGQYVDESGVLQTVPKIEGTRVEWDWKTHEWEEKATNLEIVQAQYSEYEGMDTPSVIKEMEMQDPALATELINMLIELRGLIYTLSAQESQPVGYAMIHIPTPSEALKKFKNKFNKI